MNLEEAPEVPHLHSEPALLSPASPKPIHFPVPADIPVLNNMMDVSFNQTELHMQDPAMRNTELREGAWKDEEPQEEPVADAGIPAAESQENALEQPVANDAETAPSDNNDQTFLAADTAQLIPTTADPDTDVTVDSLHAPSLGNALPAADGATSPITLPSNFSLPSNVDVQSLLASLKATPQATTPVSSAAVESAQQDPSSNETTASGVEHEAQTQQTVAHDPNTTVADAPTDQPGNDLVSALARGFTQPTPNDLTASLTSISPMTPTQAQASGLSQPRAPSSQRERKIAAGEPVTEDDMPWTQDIQQKYDAFLDEERKWVNDGKWDQFPLGSRLFVGNLSSESVTKRDIFHVFHVYGDLAQISIKQAYGFVQFLIAADCGRALSTEQGRSIKNKRIHLEISKPQKSRNQNSNNGNNNNNNNSNRNRSRSPVNRGSTRNPRYDRDANRSLRSPSPRGGYRDRYDDRQRRSRTPPSYSRSRYGRSPSPRGGGGDDDLPLPRRAPHEVPDIQVIVKDTLERDFISWVEKALINRGLRVTVLILSPRLQEDAVIRRQLLEGVLAIIRLDHNSQATGRVNLRLFNRSRGAHNVTFDDYDNLDPLTCAELVLRARSSAAPPAPAQPQYSTQYPPAAPTYAQPAQPQYGYHPPAPPQYNAPPQPQYGAVQGYPQQYSTQPLPAQPQQVDMSSLQNLLATARNGGQQQQQQQQQQQPQLPSYGYPPQQQNAYQPPAPQQMSYNAYQQSVPAVNTMLPHQQSGALPPLPSAQPSNASGGQVNMQEILARLGTYGK